ncbi:hypothetical protein C8R44DRAFT_853111 [Mycena epipterygia]|nr:hypothetical protein C8R44DRAFT_853111 [Mycena epipterygia]
MCKALSVLFFKKFTEYGVTGQLSATADPSLSPLLHLSFFLPPSTVAPAQSTEGFLGSSANNSRVRGSNATEKKSSLRRTIGDEVPKRSSFRTMKNFDCVDHQRKYEGQRQIWVHFGPIHKRRTYLGAGLTGPNPLVVPVKTAIRPMTSLSASCSFFECFEDLGSLGHFGPTVGDVGNQSAPPHFPPFLHVATKSPLAIPPSCIHVLCAVGLCQILARDLDSGSRVQDGVKSRGIGCRLSLTFAHGDS